VRAAAFAAFPVLGPLCPASCASLHLFGSKHASRAPSRPALTFTAANYRSRSVVYPAYSASAPCPRRFAAILALSPFIRSLFASDGLESMRSDAVARTEFDFAQFYCCGHALALSAYFLILIPISMSSLGRP
jgi:hypothetical protein